MSIEILIEFPLIWYMVGLCRSNFCWVILIWLRWYCSSWKSRNHNYCHDQFFYVCLNISFNFQPTKTLHIPNSCKCYGDSTEPSHLLIARDRLSNASPLFFGTPLRRTILSLTCSSQTMSNIFSIIFWCPILTSTASK